jgi:hypothetical protein
MDPVQNVSNPIRSPQFGSLVSNYNAVNVLRQLLQYEKSKIT